MIRRRISLVTGLLIVAAEAAQAGQGTGTVIGVGSYFNSGVEIFFFNTSTITATPGCNSTNRFTVTSNYGQFRTTVALLLAAYHAGTPIYVSGVGTCNNWSNAEDVNFVCAGNLAC